MFMCSYYIYKCVSSTADGRNGTIVYVKRHRSAVLLCFVYKPERVYLYTTHDEDFGYELMHLSVQFNVEWWIHAVKIHIWVYVFVCVRAYYYIDLVSPLDYLLCGMLCTFFCRQTVINSSGVHDITIYMIRYREHNMLRVANCYKRCWVV